MARSRGFDAHSARDAAMVTFWRHGFDGASYDKLVKVTGASRKGLYSIWPDKEALFCDCLQLYMDSVASQHAADIAENRRSAAAYDGFWSEVGRCSYKGETMEGCLIWRVKAETSRSRRCLDAIADRHYQELIAAFRTALVSIWAEDGAPRGADADRRAAEAASLATALWIMVGCGSDPVADKLRNMGRATRA